MDPALFLSLMLAAGIALIAGALVAARLGLLRRRQRRIRHRYAGPPPAEPAPARRADLLRRTDVARRGGNGRVWLRPLRRLWRRLRGTPRRRVLGFGIALVVLALPLWLGTGLSFAAALACAAVLVGAGVWLRERRQRHKRIEQINERVTEALDMIVRSLRVGSPVSASIRLVGTELAGPIAAEFAFTAQEISYGKDIVTALNELAERCDNQDLLFLATAVSIQHSAGGNLAEVLDRLSQITRARYQLRRKIRAVTAEAKWSGNFLSAFPVLAGAAIWAINPSYFSNITAEPFFLPLMGVIAVFLIVNVIFMRAMVNIKS